MLQTRRKLIHHATLGLCLLVLVLLFVQIIRYYHEKASRESAAFAAARHQAATVADRITFELSTLVTMTRSIGRNLTSGDLPNSLLPVRLRTEIQNNPTIFGVGAANEPEAYRLGQERYAPYYLKTADGSFGRLQIEDFYDYTDRDQPETTWYTHPLDHGADWLEPRYSQTATTTLARYAVPF